MLRETVSSSPPSSDVTFTPDEAFGEGGALAAAHPGFEFRAGQLHMARAVDQVFGEGGKLLAEAGTGTGKTLAYLIPAVQSGRRVVISTATRNLQEQIARKEVPFLRERMGLKFTALTMKGRDNYLCLHRLEEFTRQARFDFVEEIEQFGIVKRWAPVTETGDRAEVPGLSDEARFWREINARSDTCVGRRCPVYDDCHLVKMRRRAEESQLLIVNHALLFADLAVRAGDFGQVIPDYDSLVIDEAHRVEEMATQYFGRRLSSWQIRDVAEDARRKASNLAGESGVLSAAAALGQLSMELFDPLRERGEGRHSLPAGETRKEAEEAAERLKKELRRMDSALAGLIVADEAEMEGIGAVRRRCGDMQDDLDEILRSGDAETVQWIDVKRSGVILHASPIDVAGPLREQLFDPLRTVVLTSATLSVDGSLEFLHQRLGLQDAEDVLVGSPFQYEQQGRLFLPDDLPEPSSREFIPQAARVVRQLLEITEGRAFLLFTSFAHLRSMARLLKDETGYRLMVQGEAPREQLLDRFMKSPRAVLLGADSFWQGVDVPGEALSLVIIDRLPFAVPDDPLLAARLDRIRQEGGNPFMEYQVPKAVLSLKQGAGRLIRTRQDRGILCILDPRLTRKRYGRAFARSLPPFPPETDLDAVRFFFRGPPA